MVFSGGFSTVLAHAGGLVWSMYLLTAARDRRIFVGTTVILFFVTNIYKTVSYIYIDIISPEVLMPGGSGHSHDSSRIVLRQRHQQKM